MKKSKKNEEESILAAAKRGYKTALEVGNHQEEARWANVVGDIYKNRGEYVKSLTWLRRDFDVSNKYLIEKDLLPTCQSLGEVHLRLQNFSDALLYQKKHLDLAKDTDDLVEQQRASTQLGRTYHEMFLKSDSDQTSLRNAKKYFVQAMKLARTLKESRRSNIPNNTFVKEYIDCHNNIGMVEMDLDNLEEAEKVLTKGLQICDEEEVAENNDGRTRLHHNLGNVYMELRKWDKAKTHIEKDIVICQNIGHRQGEAKGYINLGELHYRVQKYADAQLCYQRAMNLAKSMDDEHALVDQINQNIEIVKEATKVMEDLTKEEQNLKKLTRNMVTARGTSGERKCLLQQNASLDRLIEKSSTIFAWKKHCEFAKKKKKIASELCDQEKLGDSYLVIGEAYQKLRNFNKANKWYHKSWETYKCIGNLEGQALAKINLGDVLDSVGKFEDALEAFREGYRIARKANLVSAQLSALENMHYSQMIRFDNAEEARKLQSQIDKLKQSSSEFEGVNIPRESCSETDTEGDDDDDDDDVVLMKSDSPKLNASKSYENDELVDDDDVPLVSLRHSKGSQVRKQTKSPEATPSRKRGRLVLSDDEEDFMEEHVGTSTEFKSHHLNTRVDELQDISPLASKSAISASSPVHLEACSSSHKSRSSKPSTPAQDFICSTIPFAVNSLKHDAGVSASICHKNGPSGPIFDACDDESCKHIIFKVEDDFVHIEPRSCKFGDKLNMELLKVEVACLYFLKLYKENRSTGLLPVIQHFKCGGEVVESLDMLNSPEEDYMCGKCWVEVSIDRWVVKRLMKLYVDCCNDLSQPPNLILLKKLYKLQVSEDEIDASDCGLEDVPAAPLLNALKLHMTIAALNISHNSLGIDSMEKLTQVFMSSNQKFGSLVLDLHCTGLSQTSLNKMCECTELLSRLEVLNISGNRLTDGSASQLSTILQNCKGLYSLNIEHCFLTSRTIQKLTNSLDSGSLLEELFIGYNSPISGNAMIDLFNKLATLKSFSKLSISGIELMCEDANDSLCNLVTTARLSELMIGSTNIKTEGAIHLMDSWNRANHQLVKLDFSCCSLTSKYIFKLITYETPVISRVIELNLEGNPLKQEGGIALASLVENPCCRLKVINLSKCQLGLTAVVGILQALADKASVEELNLSENALKDEYNTLVNGDLFELEVADSEGEEDELANEKPCVDDLDKGSMNSYQSESKSTFIQQLSSAISMAKHLRLLDVSNNGFSEQVGETLYNAWSTDLRASLTTGRLIEGKTIHLSVEPNQCRNIKPCCVSRS
ncbi:hypothetical protein CTI12_AA062960 [Artemisia annua]|uniref:Protein TONSOKU n=1 Tax=Artemisia annua TaxID=35608 RepID=A0A2U1PL40_ARTAN|nr:hypothetical protein CTI12_AA062960 [Artemisia annua]